MSYTTPVTDRTYADIAARNSKAFFNVADWTRIKGNEQVTRNLAEILLSISVTWGATADPATEFIPTAASVNALLANLENLRLAVASESIVGTETEIKDDWASGLAATSPTFADVNLWESTINAIWQHFDGDTYPVCISLTGNLTVTNGNIYIAIDCIDANNYEISLEGDAALYII